MGCLREKYLIKPVSKQSVVPSYSFSRASEPGKEELGQDTPGAETCCVLKHMRWAAVPTPLQ